jgi:hypothetical protein
MSVIQDMRLDDPDKGREEFSEDEMRRPTPRYAVPFEGLQLFDGL